MWQPDGDEAVPSCLDLKYSLKSSTDSCSGSLDVAIVLKELSHSLLVVFNW
jgi:hypothetical protein